jgi:hypothetical protein
MTTQDKIHKVLLKAVTEVKDILLETQNSIEIAQLINIDITIPEPAEHDEGQEEHIRVLSSNDRAGADSRIS